MMLDLFKINSFWFYGLDVTESKCDCCRIDVKVGRLRGKKDNCEKIVGLLK